MRALFEIYQVQFRVSLAVELQYRAEVLIWLFSSTIEPLVYLVVWSTVARSNGGSVGGYSTSTFAAYFIVLMLVNHVTFTWIMYEFEMRIRQGAFSPKLLRPIHPIHADVADNVSYKFVGLAVLIPAAVVLALLFHPTLDPAPWAIAAFVPVLVLAFVLRFILEWTLALAAFWTTRTSAMNQIYAVGVIFLSGQMAPLSLFPGPVQALATVLPFRWTVAFPVELLLGRVDQQGALVGVGVQLAWLVLSFVGLSLLWRIAVRRYSAVGA